jgi:hypothetical protein
MKICSMCSKEKSLSEFNKKSGRKNHQPYCRSCDNQKSREYYAANKEHHIKEISKRNKKYKKEIDDLIRDMKSSTKCADCNKKYHWFQMDFDHVRGKKDRPISEMVGNKVGKDRILAEIDKCEIVCANCHRLRTFKRYQKI